MLRAVGLAIEDTLAPEQRRVIVVSLLLALGILAALWLGAAWALDHLRVAGIWWLDLPIAIGGSLAALFLAWLLFPATTALVMGFFLERVLGEVESRRYPGLGAPRRLRAGEIIGSGLRLFALAAALNLLALPLYLIPPINLFIYYGLNGYLVGRGYFELVALRRMEGTVARVFWRRHRGRFFLAGIAVIVLLSLPLANLLAPVTAAAFMLHVFEALRHDAAAETFAGSRDLRLMKD
jgi:CysZ protein